MHRSQKRKQRRIRRNSWHAHRVEWLLADVPFKYGDDLDEFSNKLWSAQSERARQEIQEEEDRLIINTLNEAIKKTLAAQGTSNAVVGSISGAEAYRSGLLCSY